MRFILLAICTLLALPALADAAPPRPRTGVVTWFNAAKGRGEIQYQYRWRGQPKTKSYLAHWSQVNAGASFRALRPGQRVQFYQARRIPAPVRAVNRELQRSGLRYRPAGIAVDIRVMARSLR